MRHRELCRTAFILLVCLLGTVKARLFFSQLHPCPLSCVESGSNPVNWTVYNSGSRLAACNETMLLDFNIYNPIGELSKHTTIRACSGTTLGKSARNCTSSSSSCGSGSCDAGSQASDNATLQIAQLGRLKGREESLAVVAAASSIQNYVQDNFACDSMNIAFGYSEGAVIGVFAGARIQKQDVIRTLGEFAEEVKQHSTARSTLVQLCPSNNRSADYAFGIVAATPPSSLSLAQETVALWANGSCITNYDSVRSWRNISIHLPTLPILNSTEFTNSTVDSHVPSKRSDCSVKQVVAGDSCASLASECGITGPIFTTYNPNPNLCSTLAVGQYVCCSSGTLPNMSPKPSPNGTCYTYTVSSGDYCSAIAAAKSITVANIETYNQHTWGYMGCADLQIGQQICLSAGSPPMPAPLANAICGPQVPGTALPANISMSGALASLNPCPLNACCDIWGQCGTTDEFCTATSSATGAPGTSAAGTNGCISNCGTKIISSSPPSELFNIGYFEGFNVDRDCLVMYATDILASTANQYTHLHFAFSGISESYGLNLGGSTAAQWEDFRTMGGSAKLILSFGGWSFSTSTDSYAIFRNVVTPQDRATFISTLVQYVAEWDIAGVDFDWEYPGATDIPGIPPGNPDDGANYLSFLKDLRAALPPGKSISIAAPASYWYLRGFPIAEIGKVVDYIVFMTYDLHGQWDYGNAFSSSGCPTGNCLRSHVNYTETLNALSMITKAGVPSNKIAVGVSSYGRSFAMTTAGCTGPMCTYVGPNSAATPGECTATPGYIANAEIQDIITGGSDTVSTWLDLDSQSNILVYQGNQWVAYMDDTNKLNRSVNYAQMNFLGTADWAVDLQGFTGADSDSMDPLPDCNSADNYSTIDDITSDTSIPDFCVNMYLLNVMARTMQAALANYSAIMSDGYTDKYNAYVKQVRKEAPNQWTKFYQDQFDNYFTCLYAVPNSGGQSYTNNSGGCPPNAEPDAFNGHAYNIYAVAKDQTAFETEIQQSYGIDPSWVNNSYHYQYAPCIDNDCQDWGNFYLPGILSDFSVPDPGNLISMALANYTALAGWLEESALASQAYFFPAQDSDAVDAASTSVYMALAAVSAMQQVAEIGEEAEEAERKELILAFLSAVLLLIPGVGEAVDAIADVAIFARIASLIGDAGNGALALYGVATDPSSAPAEIIGALLGGVIGRDDSIWSKAAGVRRGMTDDVVKSLGSDVASNLSKLKSKVKYCSP